ncbi:MAG: dioxygenase, partial [Gammaproteobacteria bacterium]
MSHMTCEKLTQTVIDAMAADTAPRTREVMTSLITHLHAFVKETRPSIEEFVAGCRFLVRAGRMSDDHRDEFILIANVLGVEVLIDLIAHDGDPQTCILGPMYREGAPEYANGESIVLAMPDDGELTLIEGTVRDTAGNPLAGAVVDVWEPSTNGLYENQDPDQPDTNLRGRFRTDAAGYYAVKCLRPHGYPIPDDGPGGDLLKMLGRHPMRPGHVHFRVSAPGCEPIIARVYDAAAPCIDNDAIFAVKESVIAS